MFGCMGYNNTFERVIFMKKDSIVTELNVNNNMIGIIRVNNIDYISITDLAKYANEKNLITGTRYMNVEGMLPFENEVADYVRRSDNHVLYRVTPVFSGNNLVATGVLMEAYSVEDRGEGVCFCVFVYNVQPGIEIDYRTGESKEK